jgi:hypothetical protein
MERCDPADGTFVKPSIYRCRRSLGVTSSRPTSTAVALGRRDVVDSEQIVIRGSPILPPLHSNTCSPAHAFVAKARDDW